MEATTVLGREQPTAQWHPWWQKAVVYQVYPRSFQDSNGDGIGDLAGIASRLDYLSWLGVDAIWISPIFKSPMRDFGYDVADYEDVDPIFGTLDDLYDLVSAAHERDIRVLLDFVPNHSSSEHPWFIESRSSRDSPKRDWYLWADPKPDGSVPNNWLSMFGGPAWTWDEKTRQFYCHTFLAEQPDLNWRNRRVRDAMYDVLRFWLERGIDGFRVDVMWMLIKDDQLRDNPPNPEWKPTDRRQYDSLLPVYTEDRPEIHEIVAEMRAVVDAYGERPLIGEIYLPVERLVAYYGAHPHRPGAHLPFNFQLLLLPWEAETIGDAILTYEKALPAHGWPNWVLGNHDRPRVASRVGAAQARVANMLLLTLRGTPTLYNGDEIGITNQDIPDGLQRDPARLDGPGRGRDPFRTPMRWDATRNAGFTEGTPWLPIGDDVARINVASQRDDQSSMLTLVRRLIELRRSSEALSTGSWAPLTAADGVLAYERAAPGERFIIGLNLTSREIRFALPPEFAGEVALSTHLDRAGDHVRGQIALRPDEGLIVRGP